MKEGEREGQRERDVSRWIGNEREREEKEGVKKRGRSKTRWLDSEREIERRKEIRDI